MKKIGILAALFFFVLGCSKNEEKSTSQNEQNQTVSADYSKTDFYFKLPSKNGGEIDLSNYKGKPVMVMFFTENCPYCLRASGFIETIHQKYGPKGLEVIGISTRENIESAIEFEQKTGVKFQLAYKGVDIARNYGIAGVPYVYILDKKHNLYKFWAGYDKSYESEIDQSASKVLEL